MNIKDAKIKISHLRKEKTAGFRMNFACGKTSCLGDIVKKGGRTNLCNIEGKFFPQEPAKTQSHIADHDGVVNDVIHHIHPMD